MWQIRSLWIEKVKNLQKKAKNFIFAIKFVQNGPIYITSKTKLLINQSKIESQAYD